MKEMFEKLRNLSIRYDAKIHINVDQGFLTISFMKNNRYVVRVTIIDDFAETKIENVIDSLETILEQMADE